MLQLLEPMSLEPVLCGKRSHCNAKPTYNYSSPHGMQLEKASTAVKTQCSKKKKINKK